MDNWISVSSSNVDAFMYDSGYLYIRFKSGSIYQYDDVPLDVYIDLLTASSKGKFHYHSIRLNYKYKKIA